MSGTKPLDVPPAHKTVSRSASSSSMRDRIEKFNNLTPAGPRSRRNSDTDTKTDPTPQKPIDPANVATQVPANSPASPSGIITPMPPPGVVPVPASAVPAPSVPVSPTPTPQNMTSASASAAPAIVAPVAQLPPTTTNSTMLPAVAAPAATPSPALSSSAAHNPATASLRNEADNFTPFFVGSNRRHFNVHTQVLLEKCPY